MDVTVSEAEEVALGTRAHFPLVTAAWMRMVEAGISLSLQQFRSSLRQALSPVAATSSRRERWTAADDELIVECLKLLDRASQSHRNGHCVDHASAARGRGYKCGAGGPRKTPDRSTFQNVPRSSFLFLPYNPTYGNESRSLR